MAILGGVCSFWGMIVKNTFKRVLYLNYLRKAYNIIILISLLIFYIYYLYSKHANCSITLDVFAAVFVFLSFP